MRKLNEKDIQILQKLAPESMEKQHHHYRSILPAVSMHFAENEEDFIDRLDRLDENDLNYLATRILDGSECLLCISPEFAGIFLEKIRSKISAQLAQAIKEQYKSSTGYDA